MKKIVSNLSVIATGMILLAAVGCKKKDDKTASNGGDGENTSYYYDIADFYPGTTLVSIVPEESSSTVVLTKKSGGSADAGSGSTATTTTDDGSTVEVSVPVVDGNLIVDSTVIVGGFVSLDLSNVKTTPTGNAIGDVDVITGNLYGKEGDGKMDIHIESVEQLEDVRVKDGVENTHNMKGWIKMNGKRKDFEAPVNINQANDAFELAGDVEYDRSEFFSDEAFSHLTADQLMNDHVKVRVRLNAKGTAGKISIYDKDTGVKDKYKFREHGEYMDSKMKEKGNGFKDKDKIMEQHNREIEKLKEKGEDKNKEKIKEVNGKTIEKLKRKKAHLEKHKEQLKMQKDEINEKFKDKKSDGEKEKIKIDEKINEIDVRIKEIDDEHNRLKSEAESTDGGLNNPNPEAGNAVDVENIAN